MSLLRSDGKSLFVDPIATTAYANQQLGFTMSDKRDAALQQALTDPNAYLNARKTRKSAAEKLALDTFTNVYTGVTKDGFPADYAKSAALQAAKGVANVELGMMNLEYPDYFSNMALQEQGRKTLATLPFGTNKLTTRTHHKRRKSRKSRK